MKNGGMLTVYAMPGDPMSAHVPSFGFDVFIDGFGMLIIFIAVKEKNDEY